MAQQSILPQMSPSFILLYLSFHCRLRRTEERLVSHHRTMSGHFRLSPPVRIMRMVGHPQSPHLMLWSFTKWSSCSHRLTPFWRRWPKRTILLDEKGLHVTVLNCDLFLLPLLQSILVVTRILVTTTWNPHLLLHHILLHPPPWNGSSDGSDF